MFKFTEHAHYSWRAGRREKPRERGRKFVYKQVRGEDVLLERPEGGRLVDADVPLSGVHACRVCVTSAT